MKNYSKFSDLSQKPREKCGVFAVCNYREPNGAAYATYLGLLALQHRGQESAGLAYAGGAGITALKGMGLVDQVFTRPLLEEINASTIIGHVRYSTTGSSNSANAQPLVARSLNGSGLALAHNGNLTNTAALHQQLLNEGHIFHSTSDTEIILTYMFRHISEGLTGAAVKTMSIIEGAYAVVAMDSDQLVAFRDPRGFRPLVIGRIDASYIVASETAALDAVGAVFVREVEPGEIVKIDNNGLRSFKKERVSERALCIFEYVYFARPDSVIAQSNVHQVRKSVGENLAGRIKMQLDLVVPSPDSGVSAALGLAGALNVPFEWALYRNPYLGRTFIEPTKSGREQAVHLKFNPISHLIKGKRVALVDDSLVRGTTARILTAMLKKSGAAEVHLCIASPPYRNPCYYGIDIPLAADLAATDAGYSQLALDLGADSITFAEPEDLFNAVGLGQNNYCTACFSGCYPGYRA